MRILITGGTGFLGSHLCRRMLQDGHEVRVLSRLTSSPTALNGIPVECVLGDVTDVESVKRAVQACDWVIHAAASLGDAKLDMDRQWQVNVEGTRYAVQACLEHNVKRLLHISSVAALGVPEDPARPASEDYPFNLQVSGSPYPLSKHRAEEVVLAGVERGLDAVIVNPAFIFGPHGQRYHGVGMLHKVRRSWLVTYFGGGLCAVHVLDVVEGIVAALRHGRKGQHYILGGENLPFRALFERSARALQLRRQLVPVPRLVSSVAARVLESWGRCAKLSRA